MAHTMTASGNTSPRSRGPLRVIAATSGKGGVGKSNLIVNLGLAYAERRSRVLILDGDLGLANVDILLDRVPSATLDDVLDGSRTISDVLIEARPNLWVLPAASASTRLAVLEPTQRWRLLEALEPLADRFDVALVDTSAGVGANALFFAAGASDIMVVATPEPTAIADAYAVVKLLATRYGVRHVGLIANRVATPVEATLLFSRLSGVVGRFLPVMMDLVGSIPEDSLLRQAVMQQEPVMALHPDAPSSRAMKRIADALMTRPAHADAESRVQFFWRQRALRPSLVSASAMIAESA